MAYQSHIGTHVDAGGSASPDQGESRGRAEAAAAAGAVQIEGPLALDMTYKNDKAAEMIAYLPNAERIDNHPRTLLSGASSK